MATLVEGDLGHTEEALIQVFTETYSCATAKITTEIAAYLFFFSELMASILLYGTSDACIFFERDPLR